MIPKRTSDAAPKLLNLLNDIKRVPGVWIGRPNPNDLRHFLNGLYLGLGICGEAGGFDEYYWQAAATHGWKFSAAPAEYWMKERGMADEVIINEMLDIEIDACIRRTAAKNSKEGDLPPTA